LTLANNSVPDYGIYCITVGFSQRLKELLGSKALAQMIVFWTKVQGKIGAS
jgi:hypothetical protein